MAAVLAVCCVCCGPYRLLCGGGVPCGGKHIIIKFVSYFALQPISKLDKSYRSAQMYMREFCFHERC